MWEEFHLLRPWWLMVAPLGVGLAYLLWRLRRSAGDWENICDAHLLPHLLEGGESSRSRNPFVMLAIAWVIVAVALSGPTWQRVEQPMFESQAPRVIVLDLSTSMNATDVTPSRLTRARHKVADLLNNRPDGLHALIVFAGDAHVVYPLTDDINALLNLLPVLESNLIPLQGGQASRGLQLAQSLLTQAGHGNGEVVLVTDGVDELAQQQARALSRAGAVVNVLAVGSNSGAPIPIEAGGYLKDNDGNIVLARVDHPQLTQVARAGGGNMIKMTSDETDVQYLAQLQGVTSAAQQARDSRYKSERWHEQGPWLALLLLPFAAFAFRRGWLLVVVFAANLTMIPTTEAGWWDSLWWRHDQQAARAIEREDFDTAISVTDDTHWQGSARYRAGDYEGAVSAFNNDSTISAHYNRGNALVGQNQLSQALTAYQQALSLDPNHEDAKFNHDIVKQLLENQQQQQNQSDGSDGEENQSQDQQQQDNKTGQDGKQDSQSDNQSDAQPSSEERTDSAQDDVNSASSPDDAGQDQPAQTAAQNQNDNSAAQPEQQAKMEAGAQQSSSDKELGEADMTDVAANESRETIEQWLRRIPDDPGGLLRRKFLLEQNRRGKAIHQPEEAW